MAVIFTHYITASGVFIVTLSKHKILVEGASKKIKLL